MFRRSVLNFLCTVLGIRMASPWSPTVLPDEYETITPYCKRLASMMESKGIEHLKKWQVVRIRAFKSLGASRHEYICATVTEKTGTLGTHTTHNFAIERGRSSDPIPTSKPTINHDPQDMITSVSNSSVSSLSDMSSPTYYADDIISPLPATGKYKKDDELISNLVFSDSENPLYLHQLALLALTLHGIHQSYLLATSNCYHFAGSIVKVLEQEFEIQNTVKDSKGGKWCNLDIVSLKEWNIVSIREKYKANVMAFVSFIPIFK
jgi:hypothetical protein